MNRLDLHNTLRQDPLVSFHLHSSEHRTNVNIPIIMIMANINRNQTFNAWWYAVLKGCTFMHDMHLMCVTYIMGDAHLHLTNGRMGCKPIPVLGSREAWPNPADKMATKHISSGRSQTETLPLVQASRKESRSFSGFGNTLVYYNSLST